jgi:hypothetical protein
MTTPFAKPQSVPPKLKKVMAPNAFGFKPVSDYRRSTTGFLNCHSAIEVPNGDLRSTGIKVFKFEVTG